MSDEEATGSEDSGGLSSADMTEPIQTAVLHYKLVFITHAWPFCDSMLNIDDKPSLRRNMHWEGSRETWSMMLQSMRL